MSGGKKTEVQDAHSPFQFCLHHLWLLLICTCAAPVVSELTVYVWLTN